MMNFLQQLIVENTAPLVVDGGLATALERNGQKLDSILWSARLLSTAETRNAIYKVHCDFIKAGADVIITSSYQGSVAGFVKVLGVSQHEAEALLRQSTRLACAARDDSWNQLKKTQPARIKPIVAMSVGCYGAMLHNGAE